MVTGTPTVTAAKVAATLRKAGFTAAKWHASGQIRGWGDWETGYSATKAPAGVTVRWRMSRWENSISTTEEQNLLTLASALRSAGFVVEEVRSSSLGTGPKRVTYLLITSLSP